MLPYKVKKEVEKVINEDIVENLNGRNPHKDEGQILVNPFFLHKSPRKGLKGKVEEKVRK